MNPEQDFGKQLRRLRVARDLTQESLAEAAGCASQTVRSFENGRRRPSREMASRLADVLQVPPGQRDEFLRLARTPVSLPQGAYTRPIAVSAAAALPPTRAQRLPQPPDALIGRQHDLERLRRALIDEHQRLVTLLGPGGVGKTRLAVQAATDLAPTFTDGAAFVPLAAISDVAGVITAIATAVGCPLSSAPDPVVALATFLHERALLLVLDNLEHLLNHDQSDQLIALLTVVLREASHVSVLTTSRERLRLQAEWVVELGGLSVPPDDDQDTIAHSDAVLLFVERARRTTGDFVLSQQNQITVAQICRRLDGLPLALELAAAQASFLPPPMLLERLDQALPVLEGGARDLPARQQTMRAAIGWSHDLLSENERRVFQRLGVLVGSFSLAAAEAVGAGEGVESAQVLGLLRRLVDRSLVVRDATTDDDVRYRLLEPVRQYAVEQLEARADEVAHARHRQLTFFTTLIERLGPQIYAPQSEAMFVRVLLRIRQEYPNVRAAVSWALTHEQAEFVARIGKALAIFWWYRGHQQEPREWMDSVLRHKERLSPQGYASALFALAVTLYGGTDARSLQVGQEVLALFEQLGDVQGQAQALLFIGLAWVQDGDFAQAEVTLQRAHDMSRSVDDAWLTTEIANCLGFVWAHAGQYARAEVCLDDTLATARANQDTWNVSQALFGRALLAQAQGDLQRIADRCRAWLAFAPELVAVNGSTVGYCLASLALHADARGDAVRAARLFGAADALWEVAGMFIMLPNRSHYDHMITELRRRLADPALATAWAEGRAMNVTRAVDYALEEVYLASQDINS